ncbi:retropepsin-like aspartic protease [uncultured Algibacter sp.]|uniref:retropepsin-like aspartic protease n=1 Tax=uncultured Algibacter sp. TaxID=298659 RepID=UPI0026293F2A|nr:retropepsin-like aspartic protease [uncultured Algibacter sp.]
MHKTILNIFFCICFINASLGQKSIFKTGNATSKRYYSEIKYKNLNGKIIIPVVIKGESYQFLFDTGAPNLISENLWKKLNFEKGKDISVSDANQKKEQMRLTTLPLITIGGVSFKNTSALVFKNNDNLVFDCFKLDGIIGSNLLRKSVIQIKSKQSKLIITNDYKKLNLNKENASKLTLVGNQSSPYINIKLKGEQTATELLLFDTGASGFYDLNKKSYKVMMLKNVVKTISEGKGTSSIGMFGNANNSIQYRIQVPELIINSHSFKNVITLTGDDDNSRIGSDIIKYGNLTLDFKKGKFYFDPFKRITDLNEKLLGFTPTIQNNKLVVGIVWDKKLKNKLNFGDEILAINGVDFSKIDLCGLITEESIFKKADSLNISIKNDKGEINDLILEKR